jgi:hypothetical protein
MKRIFTLLCLLCFVQLGIAQQKVEDALRTFQVAYPLEKVYIQYNKESYIAGEKMFFKCYVFSEFAYSNQATNLYVELYNQQKQLLDKSIIPLLDGSGEGSFALNKQLDEGVYYIRAYTSWMLNYDENFPYLHRFLVYNPQSAQQVVAKPIRWEAKAFAESGNLLAGVENKLAIRLFTETFLPNSWKGVVKERNNLSKEVAHFDSFNEEIGSFQFVPDAGVSYVAEIRDNAGRVQTISLPEVKPAGVLLKVQQQADTVVCTVVFKDQTAGNGKFKLIGQMQHHLICQVNLTNLEPVVVVKLPAGLLADGIIHFTLFDSNEKPLAERLSFFSAGKVVKPAISMDTLSFEKRARNAWGVTVDTATFHTYSMLVMDGGVSTTKENFLSTLLLTNDIKYKPANAAWYLTSESAHRQAALDALLISENWRWFTWQNMLNGAYPRRDAPAGRYLSFTGTVFQGNKLQLNKDINLLFQFRDSSVVLQKVRTDSSGSFRIDGALFEDTAKVFYKINSQKASAKNIKVLFEDQNAFKKLMVPLPASPYYLAAHKAADATFGTMNRMLHAYQNQQLIDDRYKNLQEVVVKSNRASATARLNDSLSTLFFHRSNEWVYDFVNQDQNVKGYSNIMDWVNARMPQVSGGTGPQVYIDEIQMPIYEAYRMPVSNVAMVKVFKNFASSSRFNNSYGTGHIIAIYTRRGSNSYEAGLPQGFLVGYKKPDACIPFNYAEDGYEQINEDVRELLYWNTSLWPAKETAVVNFYNNDVAKSYRVIIMGFTKEGRPVYVEKIVSSEKDATR